MRIHIATPRKTMTRFLKFMKKWLSIGLLAAFFVGSLFLLEFALVEVYAKSSAYSLAPPEYPNSELVGKWQSGGPESMWDRRTYRTTENVDKVFLFFEEQMPGFKESESEIAETYYNFAQNNNWLARHAAEYACTSLYCIEKGESALTYPSASVKLYPDPDNPTGTLIEVWISWPAP